MTENNENVVDESPKSSDINISIEQICAAIIKTLGSVDVKIEDLLANYSNMSIAVNQDSETKAVTFSLVESTAVEAEAEDKQDSE